MKERTRKKKRIKKEGWKSGERKQRMKKENRWINRLKDSCNKREKFAKNINSRIWFTILSNKNILTIHHFKQQKHSDCFMKVCLVKLKIYEVTLPMTEWRFQWVYLFSVPQPDKCGTRLFLKWVQMQGRSPHAPGKVQKYHWLQRSGNKTSNNSIGEWMRFQWCRPLCGQN